MNKSEAVNDSIDQKEMLELGRDYRVVYKWQFRVHGAKTLDLVIKSISTSRLMNSLTAWLICRHWGPTWLHPLLLLSLWGHCPWWRRWQQKSHQCWTQQTPSHAAARSGSCLQMCGHLYMCIKHKHVKYTIEKAFWKLYVKGEYHRFFKIYV